MVTQNPIHLTIEEAQAILRVFTCIDLNHSTMLPDYASVRQALLLAARHSDYQILGVCADTAVQAVSSLASYLKALGYEAELDPGAIEGAVYLKFNPRTARCQFDHYNGQHRGVLVSCQSAYEDRLNETFGHLPLDLFLSDV